MQILMQNERIKTIKKCFPFVKRTNHLPFKTNFQNVDKHTGGEWLIDGPKHDKYHQLQSLQLPCRIS